MPNPDMSEPPNHPLSSSEQANAQYNPLNRSVGIQAPDADMDASPHRHISFTGHYTGYIWHKLGWSHDALLTPKGQRLGMLLYPIEAVMLKWVGHNIETTLKTRHELMDNQLKILISQYPNLQILELAAGLSPRGWWFLQHYPSIRYIEADLPAMVRCKQTALQRMPKPVPDVYAIDLFTPKLEHLIAELDPERPLMIITEGLINYFNLETLKPFWARLSQSLKPFPAGFYLTDLNPEPVHHKQAGIIKGSAQLLKYLSKSSFGYLLQSPATVEDCFNGAGFKQTQVFQPKDPGNSEQREHLDDLVWVVLAQA